jgi:hypothetical protein
VGTNNERWAPNELLSRRGILAATGVSTAGALVAMAAQRVPARAETTAVSVINVKDAPYGATGDGVTDDRAAIQAALDAVPPNGGAVFFPPGTYAVSGPLVPKSFTLLYGSHTPLWQFGVDPASGCKIRMRDGFAGEGLILPPGDTRSVTIRNLALVGAGVGSNLHGLRMPNLGSGGEQSWTLEDVEVAGFTGDGIFGRLHVVTFINCFIHDNYGWGVNASQGQRWNDCHVFGCFFFYNRQGHLYFGGTETSAAVDFVNCRFDRAGTGGPGTTGPVNPSAPGVRLANCRFITFTGCVTDANNGNGFEVVHEIDTSDYRPDFLSFVNCNFNRDGTSGADGFAGVLVRGGGPEEARAVRKVKFIGCTASYGAPNDLGIPAPLGPKYGVWYENTVDFWWIGTSEPAPVPGTGEAANAYPVGGGHNVRPLIVDMARGLVTIPTVAPDPALTVPDGALYFDPATNRINVRSNGAWKSVALS